ncbi:phosphoribosylanthranilate isomerase [Methanoregula sp.]|uniref:phosphoribosylanthranilate isomerase n=1 Tax=Methanoregula sp. TaxID=2052170 RepID=UPI000CAA1C36|nr:phosphoribosylanthranilate isomerase [Methanoregula sp.]PKG32333.1 MAG: N-(5'-phosphoribosyl)anthranilate isomerase [Methanoregula sp.]
MRIKICGIPRPEDARFAEDAGADAIGVVVCSGDVSRRNVPLEQAERIFKAVGPFITTVAVSHTTSGDELRKMIALRPDAIQISHPFTFDKDPGVKLIRVVGRGEPLTYDCDAIIVDDSHGTGRTFDHSYARDAVRTSGIPVILAGGLTPENVRDAIREVRPYAVDVASGVEVSPGIKDHKKIKAFIAACRTQEQIP